MASLYIKDPETAAAVARVARRLGTSKTQVVRDAVRRVEDELDGKARRGNWRDWIRDYRASNPLPEPMGPLMSKADFDEMWGDG
ncbi:type II toxin-antitoxin system VapB family antitoxin [Sphingomonas silueang]|uniref:type II toxin-antitoxin system VapB family antitoxin n=1 Tax=Sphingomonas silueang TaxID=3156617 RepID=UPI0032B4846E